MKEIKECLAVQCISDLDGKPIEGLLYQALTIQDNIFNETLFTVKVAGNITKAIMKMNDALYVLIESNRAVAMSPIETAMEIHKSGNLALWEKFPELEELPRG